MKAMIVSFSQMLRQMKHDTMLVMIALCPFLMGIFFRFVIPTIESVITTYFDTNEILAPYYTLFDTVLVMIIPSMFNFAAAMVMLEESDDHVTAYLSVTPLGKTGYIFSRLGFTGFISFFVSIIAVTIFHLSRMNIPVFLGAVLAGSIHGSVAALLIVALSKNKVEGMAVGKFASLLNLGILVPFFVKNKVQFIASIFPSFWIGKAMQSGIYFLFVISIIIGLLWIWILSKRIIKKIIG